MKKNAFTLSELLVTLSILAILVSLVMGGVGGCNTGPLTTFNAEVIRKYEVVTNETTYFRVDIRRPKSEFIETLGNYPSFRDSKSSPTTLHANLLEHNWYSFQVRGVRNESWGQFPNIISTQKIENPNVNKGEISY